jgi:uncharacterized protein with GYD domain
MPIYVSLLNWTDQGIRNVRATLQRSKGAVEFAENYGVRIKAVYWTVGSYDSVVIAEAPDDMSFSTFMFEVGSRGSVRSNTLRAYSDEEMAEMMERLGPETGT